MWLFRKLLETLASKGASRTEGLNPARTATAPKMIKVFLEALPFLSHSSPRKQAGSTHRNSVLRQGLTGHVSLWIHQGLMIRSLLMAGCSRWKGLSYSRFFVLQPMMAGADGCNQQDLRGSPTEIKSETIRIVSRSILEATSSKPIEEAD